MSYTWYYSCDYIPGIPYYIPGKYICVYVDTCQAIPMTCTRILDPRARVHMSVAEEKYPQQMSSNALKTVRAWCETFYRYGNFVTRSWRSGPTEALNDSAIIRSVVSCSFPGQLYSAVLLIYVLNSRCLVGPHPISNRSLLVVTATYQN